MNALSPIWTAADAQPVVVQLSPGQSGLLTFIGGVVLFLAVAGFVGYFGRRGPGV